MTLTLNVRGVAKVASAWFATVFAMSLAFGTFITVDKLATGDFLDRPSVNWFDEVLGWAAISGIFVAIASLFFALPALAIARAATTLSLTKLVGLGAVVGPIGACIIGAPLIAHYNGLAMFALIGAFCGMVGAATWWFLYERSSTKQTASG